MLFSVERFQNRDRSNQGYKHRKGSFKQHPRSDFGRGKVFKKLSAASTSATTFTEGSQTGEKLQRFVIIGDEVSQCFCLPIETYGGRGTAKTDVEAKEHAIVYTDRPILLEGEETLSNPSIRVISSSPQHPLPREARLNYGALNTFHYADIKVCFIGQVHPESERAMKPAIIARHPSLQRFWPSYAQVAQVRRVDGFTVDSLCSPPATVSSASNQDDSNTEISSVFSLNVGKGKVTKTLHKLPRSLIPRYAPSNRSVQTTGRDTTTVPPASQLGRPRPNAAQPIPESVAPVVHRGETMFDNYPVPGLSKAHVATWPIPQRRQLSMSSVAARTTSWKRR